MGSSHWRVNGFDVLIRRIAVVGLAIVAFTVFVMGPLASFLAEENEGEDMQGPIYNFAKDDEVFVTYEVFAPANHHLVQELERSLREWHENMAFVRVRLDNQGEYLEMPLRIQVTDSEGTKAIFENPTRFLSPIVAQLLEEEDPSDFDLLGISALLSIHSLAGVAMPGEVSESILMSNVGLVDVVEVEVENGGNYEAL